MLLSSQRIELEKKECQICFETKILTTLKCGCEFCFNCLEIHVCDFNKQLHEPKKCPDFDCKKELSYDDMMLLIKEEEEKKIYEKIVFESFLVTKKIFF